MSAWTGAKAPSAVAVWLSMRPGELPLSQWIPESSSEECNVNDMIIVPQYSVSLELTPLAT